MSRARLGSWGGGLKGGGDGVATRQGGQVVVTIQGDGMRLVHNIEGDEEIEVLAVRAGLGIFA